MSPRARWMTAALGVICAVAVLLFGQRFVHFGGLVKLGLVLVVVLGGGITWLSTFFDRPHYKGITTSVPRRRRERRLQGRHHR